MWMCSQLEVKLMRREEKYRVFLAPGEDGDVSEASEPAKPAAGPA